MSPADLWRHQDNYVDGANVDDNTKESQFRFAQANLRPWKAKTHFLKMLTSDAARQLGDRSLDYVYIAARHDYCGVTEDLQNYWPKVRRGGIVAGHDFLTAPEQQALKNHTSDWSICVDGSVHPGAVKGAVLDFAVHHNVRVYSTTIDRWPSWVMVKP
jgi:hypothetical protein